jgi:hypothetical protein
MHQEGHNVNDCQYIRDGNRRRSTPIALPRGASSDQLVASIGFIQTPHTQTVAAGQVRT